MRAPRLIPLLVMSCAMALAVAGPASAQLSGGVGSSNAANHSFQQQNAMRGMQQQQTFNNNQVSGQRRTDQMNSNTSVNPGGYIRRGHR